MSPARTADVVVIGAGCIGASVAFRLAERGASVVVLEREPMAGTGSTGHCAGGVRQQFSTAVNVLLSKASVITLENFQDEVGAEPGFDQCGYLFCLADEATWRSFQKQLALWRSLDVPAEALTPEEARAIVPGLEIGDLVGCTFCPTDGIADPHLVTQGFVAAARRHGAVFELGRAATGVRVENGRVRGVLTAEGEIAAPVVVNAAGPYAAEVARWAGVELPVAPLRRQMFTTQPLPWVTDKFPMIVDMKSGVYMHRESGGILVGLADKNEPPSFNTNIDFEFRDLVFSLAMERVPALEEAEYRAGWAGLYETTPDHNAILGPVPGLEGFQCANGFSGHGFMQSPAIGRVIAGFILDGRSPIEVSELSIERFQRHELLVEANVI
ncbi:MAG TPA: FAD-binding oxidoreductase [Candidatus Eisenbacteria bacterium]|nr:FAD-binding oxidoreductase [Candidatus Eisenbacteria bacterium]